MVDKPTILVTRKLPESVETRAAAEFSVRLRADETIYSADDLVREAEGCDGILTAPGDTLDADTIARLPASVKALSTFSVGYDHIDTDAARDRGIAVFNTPDVLTDATADIAMLLILGAARRASEGERMIRNDAWTGWKPTQLLGTQVTGKRLAILGMGRIGMAVARRARGFDMEIHYHKRSRLGANEEQGAVYHDSPESLLKVADFLSIHSPLTPETKHFLNAERIELLPEGAIVVNTARGPVVDDEALIAALKRGRVAAAGLDVFTGEPKINSGYRPLENTFLLPHLGSATAETRQAMGDRAIDNLKAFFSGSKPPSRVV